jgi:predicted nucleic acid-binding protein
MPHYFFDSSAIVKRYHREAGPDWIRAVCEARPRPLTYLSQIGQVEVVCGLRRAGRIEGMHSSAVDALVNLFLRHVRMSHYLVWQITPGLVASAIMLCNRYWDVDPGPLCSLDAIQLASARAVAASISDELILVTADVRVAAVAAFEGLRVVNSIYPPTPRP